MEQIRTEIIESQRKLSLANPIRKLTADKLIENATRAGELQYTIDQAKKQLTQLTQKSIDQAVFFVFHQKSTPNKIMSTIIRTLAQFRPGYGDTKEKRGKAQAIIRELETQQNKLGLDYTQKIDYFASNPYFHSSVYDMGHIYNNSYLYDMRKFGHAIRQQEIIAGKALLPYLWNTEQGPVIRQKH